MKSIILYLGQLVLLLPLLRAQSFEIRTVNKGNGVIGVEVRNISGTSPGTTNFVTDITFGLKWLSTYSVDLENGLTTSFSIVKSDIRKEKGGFHFQAFSAANTPFNFPTDWLLNDWVEIMSVSNTRNSLGTGMFSLTEPGFDLTTDPNFGVDLIDYRPVIASSASNVVLPVSLSHMSVQALNGSIQLKWKTLSEQNSHGFDIERSNYKDNNYKKIGFVASGHLQQTQQSYEFVDKNVKEGKGYFYRLKQLDNDGNFKYSQVKYILLRSIDGPVLKLTPNPVKNSIQLHYREDFFQAPSTITIVDAKGVVYYRNNLQRQGAGIITIPVIKLGSGNYHLIVEKDRQMVYSKIFNKL